MATGFYDKFATWKYCFVIVISIVIVYGSVLTFDFVNYDDYPLVYLNSSYLSNISNIVNAFSTHAFSEARKEGAYYRPLLMVSYIIDYHMWKLNPAGYHLTNIFLHCLNAIFVFLLIQSIVKIPPVALFASLLFALHPIQVESVAWIAGRDNILMGLFIVLMIFFYLRQYEKPEQQRRYFFLSVIFFALALFAKEASAFFLLVLPIYEILIRKNSLRTLLSWKYLQKLAVIVAVFGFYLLIRINVFGEVSGLEKLYGGVSLVERLKHIPAILCENLSLLCLPIHLSVEHPLAALLWLNNPWAIVAVFILAIVLGICWWSWKYNSILFFSLLWVCIGLLPLLNIFPLGVPIMEHRLYTVLIGFSFFLSYIVYYYVQIRYPKISVAIQVITIACIAIGTFERSSVWRNSESLWVDTIEKAPTASRSYLNLAGYYYDRQEYKKTIELMKKYVELKPEDWMGYSKLRDSYFLAGSYDTVAQVCRKMIEMDPHNANRYIDLGTLFEKLNFPDSALNIYQEGLRFDSTFYQIHVQVGRLVQNFGDTALAEDHYLRAINLKPDYAPAYFGMGTLYKLSNKYPEAIQWIEEGMKYANPPSDIIQLLEFLFSKTRQTDNK